jgi:hypothetical protein
MSVHSDYALLASVIVAAEGATFVPAGSESDASEYAHSLHSTAEGERVVREVGYGLSLEGASSAALVKSKQSKR